MKTQISCKSTGDKMIISTHPDGVHIAFSGDGETNIRLAAHVARRLAANLLKAAAEVEDGHPEAHCDRCGGLNITWFADSELWNKATAGRWAILCPLCFVELAQAQGIKPTSWRICPEAL
jgi:hypothetical protein